MGFSDISGQVGALNVIVFAMIGAMLLGVNLVEIAAQVIKTRAKRASTWDVCLFHTSVENEINSINRRRVESGYWEVSGVWTVAGEL